MYFYLLWCWTRTKCMQITKEKKSDSENESLEHSIHSNYPTICQPNKEMLHFITWSIYLNKFYKMTAKHTREDLTNYLNCSHSKDKVIHSNLF